MGADTAAGRRGSFTAAIEAALDERGVPFSLDPQHVEAAAPAADGRPYSTVRHRHGDGWRELVLGAPEVVAEFGATGAGDREGWSRLIADEAGRGGRLLLLAARTADAPWQTRALIRFGDPIRDDVPAAVAEATRAGIQTMMVTGDHLDTASAIADAVGLPPGEAITGSQLDALTDAELPARMARMRLVARAIPEQSCASCGWARPPDARWRSPVTA